MVIKTAKRRPRRRWALTCALASATAILCPGTATGVNPEAQDSPAIGRTLESIDSVIHKLNADAYGGATDLALATASADGRSVTIWTASGKTPSRAATLLDRTEAKVNVRKAPLSRTEITRLEATVLAHSRLRTPFAGAHITGIDVDFTGPVRILVDSDTAAAEHAIRLALGNPKPTDVVITKSDRTILFTRTESPGRLDDSAPYFAGARLKMAGGGQCTSGFGGKSRTNGQSYLLTAEHCVNNRDPRFWDGGDDFMGFATARYGIWDAAAIKVSSGQLMYIGPYTSATSVPVDEVVAPIDKMHKRICTSGSYGGMLCNGATINGYRHFGSWCTASGACYPDLVVWYADNSSSPHPIAGQGDSGGPVVIDPAQTNGATVAVGLVHGFWGHEVDCVGAEPARRLCSSGLKFADVSAIARKWSLTLSVR